MENIKNLKLRFIGTSPLLMHADTLSNPLDPATKDYKKISTKRNKTDEDHAKLSEIQFKTSLYWVKDVGAIMPSRLVKAVLVRGARKTKLGKLVESGVFLSESYSKLIHSGGDTKEALWANPDFKLMTSVVVSKARVLSTRPKFDTWSFVTELNYDSNIINKDQIIQAANTGGKVAGLGSWRVEKGGDFGRFTVEEVK